MPSILIRNIPDEIHQGIKNLAARRGRSAEAEVRDILAAAVREAHQAPIGQSLAAIWGEIRLTDDEVAMIESARDMVAAEPMSFGE